MGMNIDASGTRTYWRITPEDDTRLCVYSLELVAAISGSISTYANFLGVTLTSDSQIEIEVYINDSAKSVLSDGSDSSIGIQSIGDLLVIDNNNDVIISPGFVRTLINFQTLAMPNGIVLNGYGDATKISDSLSISHKADLSGLDYMNVSAQVKRLFLP